jgi:SAM-dependent methyltransferase
VKINPVAGAGFTAGAEAYERGRPSYPQAAVDGLVAALGIGPGRRVIDLAAGTGKLTRLLLPTGADLVAIEPVPAMGGRLHQALPQVPLTAGTAEALPIAGDRADAITVAQAFHWFDAPRALAEMARVLRPGGGLGLIWNERDESVPWVRELGRIIRWDLHMTWVGTDWREVVDASGRFTPMRRQSFPYGQDLDVDALIDRVTSTSFVAAMSEGERAPLLEQVRVLVAGFPPRFTLPYVTATFWCHRVGP